MLDENSIEFARELGQKQSQRPFPSAHHPALVTRDLLAECKGPDAEWLAPSPATAPVQHFSADARAAPAALPSSNSSKEPAQPQMPPAARPKPASTTSTSSSGTSSSRGGSSSRRSASAPEEAGTPSPDKRASATPRGAVPQSPAVAPGGKGARITPGNTPDGGRGLEGLPPRGPSSSGSGSGGSSSSGEALPSRLKEAAVLQLREERAVAEMRAEALADDVHLSMAALEASQAAKLAAERQAAQATAALAAALAEQRLLVEQLDDARSQLCETQERVEALEYSLELLQAERQAANDMSLNIGDDPPTPLDGQLVTVGQLSAELCALRGQLEEANRTKAVLASKLQAARSDNAALLGRMQASAARHAAELARMAAAGEERCAALEAEVVRLEGERTALEAQVQLLQRQAAGGAENERSAALAGIVRQREEQLVQAHMEMAQLQSRIQASADSDARCAALEARLEVVLAQHAQLADRLSAAQQEAGCWRSSLSKLSDELAGMAEREASAKSALADTVHKLAAQAQLCDAQAHELDMLRATEERRRARKAARAEAARRERRSSGDGYGGGQAGSSVSPSPTRSGGAGEVGAASEEGSREGKGRRDDPRKGRQGSDSVTSAPRHPPLLPPPLQLPEEPLPPSPAGAQRQPSPASGSAAATPSPRQQQQPSPRREPSPRQQGHSPVAASSPAAWQQHSQPASPGTAAGSPVAGTPLYYESGSRPGGEHAWNASVQEHHQHLHHSGEAQDWRSQQQAQLLAQGEGARASPKAAAPHSTGSPASTPSSTPSSASGKKSKFSWLKFGGNKDS